MYGGMKGEVRIRYWELHGQTQTCSDTAAFDWTGE